MNNHEIPFNKTYSTKREIEYISNALKVSKLSGDGIYTKKCHEWLEINTGCSKALLTHSCTGALEISAMLSNIEPGDEVIMPSYTFVSTANAFVLRGAIPVFVDIRMDTCNIDENLIEEAITEKTKAIVVVHYAGVACEMNKILEISKRNNLMLIEDAAQAVMSKYNGRTLGSIGDIGTYSFHETKNIISGEGGAIIVNNKNLAERAEFIREKGTDRSRFLQGKIDKYTWVDIGSSYLPSDIIAAFLWAQMEEAENITKKRLNVWNYYHKNLEPLEEKGLITRPTIPQGCEHNAHMYYVLLKNKEKRNDIIKRLDELGINAIFHYIPLHNSPMGISSSRSCGDLKNTINISDRIMRLPLWIGVNSERVTDVLMKIL